MTIQSHAMMNNVLNLAEPRHRRRTRRRKSHHKKIKLVIIISLLLIIFCGIMEEEMNIIFDAQAMVLSDKTIAEPDDALSEVKGKWLGLCPKLTIHSIQEFHTVVMSDPVLASYYLNFDWNNAQIGSLKQDVWVHVSHRKDNNITVSKKLIRLPKGDLYISDGITNVRMYCCNSFLINKNVTSIGNLDNTKTLEDIIHFNQYATNRYATNRNSGLNYNQVEEPNSFILFLSGLIVLAKFNRRVGGG